MKEAIEQWKLLLKNPDIINVTLLQTSFWFCMSAIQFTVFPIYCQSVGITTAQLGSYYTLAALTNVVLSRPASYFF
eukprot:UN32453